MLNNRIHPRLTLQSVNGQPPSTAPGMVGSLGGYSSNKPPGGPQKVAKNSEVVTSSQ